MKTIIKILCVIITNSYCDYKPSNNNLTVIDVCG